MSESKAPSRDLTGVTLGDFCILRLLGQGGMGDVYEAEQTSLQRRVALKVLREDLVHDSQYLHRFKAEATAVAPIHHPNIVSVIAIGECDGVHYIALEFVDGRNLREHIRREGALDERETLVVLKKVAAALQRAHEENIVHRDVKPENILLTRKTPSRPSEVKVADFGLARKLDSQGVNITQSGVTMGTPLYMSPEQVKGKLVDPRSDVYSLGVTAYYMLAGEPPYRGETALAVAIQHLQGEPADLHKIRPDVSPELCALVHRMMAVAPDDRVQSAREVLKELNRIRPLAGRGGDHAAELTISKTQPAAPAGATRLMNDLASTSSRTHLSRVGAALADRRRRSSVVAATLLAAFACGGAVAWSQREKNPLTATVAAAKSGRPATNQIKPFEDAEFELQQAVNAGSSDHDREVRLWAVLDNHPDAEGVVLDASVALLEVYLGRCDYSMILELAQWLRDQDHRRTAEEKTYGALFRGVVASRQGSPQDANDLFWHALRTKQHVSPALFKKARTRILAKEFLLCLRRNGDQPSKEAGNPPLSVQLLTTMFWDRLMPAGDGKVGVH